MGFGRYSPTSHHEVLIAEAIGERVGRATPSSSGRGAHFGGINPGASGGRARRPRESVHGHRVVGPQTHQVEGAGQFGPVDRPAPRPGEFSPSARARSQGSPPARVPSVQTWSPGLPLGLRPGLAPTGSVPGGRERRPRGAENTPMTGAFRSQEAPGFEGRLPKEPSTAARAASGSVRKPGGPDPKGGGPPGGQADRVLDGFPNRAPRSSRASAVRST
ncbi:MAG: hypothetical protein CM1200mP26_27100 [Acidimicrobiales bacterium]|nr:MAG: hypothetical protein CM1200mP26_27100 [Acidimicrobiales bacterium]